MKFDILIMDDQGNELVEIEEFAVKRVGAAAAQELRTKGSHSGEEITQPSKLRNTGTESIKDGILPRRR